MSARLERLIARAVGPRFEAQEHQLASLTATQEHRAAAVQERLDRLTATTAESATELARLRAQFAQMEATVDATRAIAASTLDEIPRLRRRLLEVRASADYERVWAERDPLVTVCIPTYSRSELLVQRALPSVVRQTHQHFEVIVVGDGCTDETARRVEDFADSRVRFVNMPFRFPYPDDAERRWLVAGSPGMNLGAQLARGSWIAMLGDDDEFAPDHLERLLECALSSRFEMAYGQILQHRPPPQEDFLHSTYPPELGGFGVQAALYMAAIRFFDFNVTSWVVGEPGDWNLCRRMMEAGVRIGFVDRVVTHYYPSKLRDEDTGPA